MIKVPLTPGEESPDEIATLVRTLHETQQRLRELTGGEVDAVLHPGGHSYLLHEAQEKLRWSETIQHDLAATQSSILNALPAHIALLDHEGAILSVNEGWRQFAGNNGFADADAGVGLNYLDVCDRTSGYSGRDAREAATGIRAVLGGQAGEFTLEYPCHSPTEQRWFQLRVSPMESDEPRGAVVMHVMITERKRVEEELRWKTAFLEAQVAASLDGLLVVDPKGKKILQNQRLNELLKIPAHIADDPEDGKQLQWVTSVVRNAESFLKRVVYLNAHPNEIARDEIELKDGTVLDRYSAPVVGQDEKYYGRIWTFRDITESKRTEAAIRQRTRLAAMEADVQLAVQRPEALPETLQGCCEAIVQHLDGAFARIWLLNEREQMLELQASAGLYTHLDGPHSRVPVGQFKIGWIAKEGKPHLTNHVVGDPRVSDQEWAAREGMVAFAGHPLLVKDRLIGVVAMFARQPLTELAFTALATVAGHISVGIERKQADEHIAEQAALIDEARDAILVRDLEHRITFWSKGAERLYGWTADEARGSLVDELLKADATAFGIATQTVLETGVWNGEIQKVARNGNRLTADGRWTLLRDDQGKPLSILSIDTDITERKKIEQQFLRAQRMEGIGTLASGIAHDLNNSLAPIMMALEVLKMRCADPASQELLGIIATSAQRGADMVRQVLSFGRGVEGRRMEVQIKHLVRDIEKIANDTFLKHVSVRTVVPRDLWTVSGDPTQLHQVLLNLCVNSRDAMPDGGTLTISAKNVVIDAQYAGLNLEAAPGHYVSIEVEDTGTGMPPDVLEKMFDPFFTTKELGKGTGLGLSTSLGIVKSHGGFIRVYSEPRKGTKFSIYLPASVTTSGEIAPTLEAEMPRGHGELILVVDDEPAVREITRQTLEAFGYRVVLASDGAEAVATYAGRPTEIAALLTDMMMPGIDGPAVIQVLLRINPHLPIIAASGLSTDVQIAKLTRLGVKQFLAKPYTADVLLKALKEVLAQKT